MMKIGFVDKGNNRYIVCWYEGDRITIPALGTMIATNTREKQEALEICRRNLIGFVAF